MADFVVLTPSGASIDELWGSWQATLMATPTTYRVQLTSGQIVEYQSTAGNFTYSGAPGAEQPAGGTYITARLVTVNGAVVTTLALLDNVANQPLTGVFSNPDATVLAGGDVIEGSAGADVLRGFGGDDTLAAGSNGVDQLYGGDGSDTLYATASINDNRVYATGSVLDGGTGGSNVDTLAANGLADLRAAEIVSIERLAIGSVADSSAAMQLDARQFGGSGLSSTLAVEAGANVHATLAIYLTETTGLDLSGLTFTGWGADDGIVIASTPDNDTITGSSQSEYFSQIVGADTLNGGGGNDFFELFFQALTPGLTINGGAGVDTLTVFGNAVIFSSSSLTSIEALRFNAASGNVALFNASQIGGAGLASGLAVKGSNGADAISILLNQSSVDLSGFTFTTWDPLVDRVVISGAGLADTIVGSVANDSITGGGGADTITGGAGGDTLNGGSGADTINAGDNDDRIVATHDDGNDTYTGGNGFDTLDFSGVNGVVQVNQLAGTVTGSAGNDTLLDVIEQIIGTNFDDVLSGGHGINILDGNGGADQFFGNNGDDLMRGGAGADRFYANTGDGSDRIQGDGGDDTIYFANSDGGDRLLGGDGFDILDYSTLDGVVQVNQLDGITTGTAGGDKLEDVFEMVIGTAFGDVLSGGHGGNSLKGNGGADQIFANNGDDYMSGGTGNDTLTGGVGNDTQDMRNGEGIDTWLDFTAGGTDDTITLTYYSGLGFNTFAGLEASGRLSTTVSGHTELALNGGDTIIFNNIADHKLLTAADFIFA